MTLLLEEGVLRGLCAHLLVVGFSYLRMLWVSLHPLYSRYCVALIPAVQ